MTRFILISLLALGCRTVDLYPTTEVKLEVAGETYDYTAANAQWEEEEDRYSVYLLPADTDNSLPYVNLRYYSGNPVGHFWLRYDGDDDEKPMWECFVPGVLHDGTETLTWTKSNGDARERTDTGEATCKVTVTKTADSLTLDFDVDLLKEKSKKGGHGGGGDGAADGSHEERVQARGSAVLTL